MKWLIITTLENYNYLRMPEKHLGTIGNYTEKKICNCLQMLTNKSSKTIHLF